MKHVQGGVFWLFPTVEVFAIDWKRRRHQAKQDHEKTLEDEVRQWQWHFEQQPEGGEIARTLYRTDVERLRRLEDKLRSGLSFVAPLVPLSTVLVGLALKTSCWAALIAFVLASGSLVQLAGAYLLIRQGTASFPLFLSGSSTLAEALGSRTNIKARIAAVEMVSSRRNQERGIQLNNAIAGVDGSLLRSLVCLAAAAGILVYLRY